ncbi:MAG: Rieske (2Fe-2S) protein [Marinilabiliales bacterium]|nr:MAG: Rieske (2Fe-2S) protein [Marinilabiliales bacterium]
MFPSPKLIKIFIISLLISTFIGCDDYDNWIPNVRVDEYLFLSHLQATLGINQAMMIDNAGVNGILLFRLEDRQFNAFDRTCPFQPEDNCAVDFDDAELRAVCPCCGSEFELFFNGDVVKGPARRPLKQYRTVIEGSRLRITN